jgi:hypothetical protein
MTLRSAIRKFPSRSDIVDGKLNSSYKLDNTDLYVFILDSIAKSIRKCRYEIPMLDPVFNFYSETIAKIFDNGRYANYILENWYMIIEDIVIIVHGELPYLAIYTFDDKFTIRIII